jgi:hypothetical protein
MVLALKTYITDIGKKYIFLPVSLSIRDANNESIASDIRFVDFLSDNYRSFYEDSKFVCRENQIIPRRLKIYLVNPQINLTFSFPEIFNQSLLSYLTNDSRIKAFEFLGEKIRHSKLELIL